MSDWAAKRFWKDTVVEQVDTGFTVLLDGRRVKTPAKTPLIVPTRALADAIAAEWAAQEDKIDPETMPYTRGANSALDRVSPQFNDVAALIADYAGTDLLCYRADHPEELIARQAQAWDPIIDWAKDVLEAPLNVGFGVMHIDQDPSSVTKLQKFAYDLTPFQLTGFYDLVSISGSYLLGVAVIKEHCDAKQAWALSRIDEQWQIDQWGVDEDAESIAMLKEKAFLQSWSFFQKSFSD